MIVKGFGTFITLKWFLWCMCYHICDCRFRWERNLFSHMLNSPVLIVWMVLCFFRLSSVAKVWLHSSHFWFFINLCLGKVIFSCLLFLCFIRLLWKIGSLQISHWTFSSCDLMWWESFALLKSSFKQIVQLKSSSDCLLWTYSICLNRIGNSIPED